MVIFTKKFWTLDPHLPKVLKKRFFLHLPLFDWGNNELRIILKDCSAHFPMKSNKIYGYSKLYFK